MMSDLLTRLRAAREKAYFTVSDMATWFGVGRTNMDQWITQAHEPRPHTQKQLIPLVALLENVLSDTAHFPVPLEVKQHERATYIKKVKAHATTRFSTADTAGRGDEVLGKHQSEQKS